MHSPVSRHLNGEAREFFYWRFLYGVADSLFHIAFIHLYYIYFLGMTGFKHVVLAWPIRIYVTGYPGKFYYCKVFLTSLRSAVTQDLRPIPFATITR